MFLLLFNSVRANDSHTFPFDNRKSPPIWQCLKHQEFMFCIYILYEFFFENTLTHFFSLLLRSAKKRTRETRVEKSEDTRTQNEKIEKDFCGQINQRSEEKTRLRNDFGLWLSASVHVLRDRIIWNKLWDWFFHEAHFYVHVASPSRVSRRVVH